VTTDTEQPGVPDRDPQPSRGGRPTKLTEERMMRFLDAIEEGHFREPAARLAGFSPATMYRWLAIDEEPYLTFQRVVEETEAKVEAKALGVIMDRIPDDPRLAMNFLGRRFGERWGSTREPRPQHHDEPAPQPLASPVNVLVVERGQLDDAVEQRLDEHREQTGGNALSQEDLAHHRENDAEKVTADPETAADPEVLA
jgi:hypothetical protein